LLFRASASGTKLVPITPTTMIAAMKITRLFFVIADFIEKIVLSHWEIL